MSTAVACPLNGSCAGNSAVRFDMHEDGSLTTVFQTNRLHLRSVTSSESNLNDYAALFGDPEVMCKYARGVTKTKEEIAERINSEWVKRWHTNDPYSGLAVSLNATGEFLGHAMVEHGDAPGQAELAYFFKKSCWRHGYEKEAAGVLVNEYVPATIRAGYTLEGKVLEKIEATARPNNTASVRILEGLGMLRISEIQKFGALRYLYSIDVHI